MSGIEFLPEHPGDTEPEEVLPAAPHRRPPSWLVALIGLVVVAAAIVAVAHLGGSKPAAPPSSSATSSPAAPASLAPISIHVPADDNVGLPLVASADRPTVGVQLAGRRVWLLQPRTLLATSLAATLGTGPGARTADVQAPIPGRPLSDDSADGSTRLVLDAPSNRVWVVSSAQHGGRVLEYDAATLRLEHDVQLTQPVNGAAALGGHLYLAGGAGLLDVAPNGAKSAVPGIAAMTYQIVADPTRARLLVTDVAQSTHVWAVTPRAAGPARVAAPVSVAATKASLAVTADGAIWLGGFDTGDGVLMRLDPHTLLPSVHSPLDPQLEPGAIVIAGGQSSVWVRDGGVGANLRCIDAATGRQLQSWTIDGPVASSAARAVVATYAGAVPLVLSSCPG